MYRSFIALFLIFQIAGCATYQRKSLSFKAPTEYINHQEVASVHVGAEAFADQSGAEDAFGFDVIKAGLLPVQVVIDNRGGETIEVVPGQTFLLDDTNRYWKLLSTRESVERVQKATEAGWITSGAGKGAGWGAAAGAILGLAIGIVSGRNVGEAVLKGGVLGGAGGAIIGGASKGGEDRKLEYQIADDLREKGLEGKLMAKDALASGFIFFPSEAKSAKELRLQLKFRESGVVKTLILRLK